MTEYSRLNSWHPETNLNHEKHERKVVIWPGQEIGPVAAASRSMLASARRGIRRGDRLLVANRHRQGLPQDLTELP
jgi:hypothetical protein